MSNHPNYGKQRHAGASVVVIEVDGRVADAVATTFPEPPPTLRSPDSVAFIFRAPPGTYECGAITVGDIIIGYAHVGCPLARSAGRAASDTSRGVNIDACPTAVAGGRMRNMPFRGIDVTGLHPSRLLQQGLIL